MTPLRGPNNRSQVRRSGWHEVLIFGALMGLCPVVAAIEPGTIVQAQQNARSLLDIEASLGIASETSFVAWLEARPLFADVVNFLYYSAHLSAVIAVLLWSWHRRPSSYRLIRNTFATTQLLVVAGYLALPTSPPRLLQQDPSELANASGFVTHIQYAHAAFPSGHVAFAMFVALALAITHPPRWIRSAGYVYPLFVTWMVIATGNHYWLDAAGGLVVATASVALVVAIDLEHRSASSSGIFDVTSRRPVPTAELQPVLVSRNHSTPRHR